MKKSVLFFIWIIFVIALFIFGILFIDFYRTEITVPLGEIMFNFNIISIFFPLCCLCLYDYIKKIKINKKKKIKLYFEMFVMIIFMVGIVFYLPIKKCVFSSIDLINGTSEIIISDAELIEKKFRRYKGRTTTKYYLKGTTLEKEKREIEIRYRQKDDFIDLLEGNYSLKVYYFKQMNLVYDIEVVNIDNISNNYIE